MIEGIDIFQPRENGLPDFTKISPAQIFNGSVAANMNQKLDPYGFNQTDSEGKPAYRGIPGEFPKTTLDPITVKPVEVRRAMVVQELLNGGGAVQRGHTGINGGRRSSGGGGHTVVGNYSDIDLPSNPALVDGQNPSILVPAGGPPVEELPPPSGWHPPMLPDYDPGGPSSVLLPPIDALSPPEKKSAALNRLPTMLLDELKNLRLV